MTARVDILNESIVDRASQDVAIKYVMTFYPTVLELSLPLFTPLPGLWRSS